ncbi:MAG: hypothetical protein NVS9B4_17360 [Candidatus Acidiferrum sp.]
MRAQSQLQQYRQIVQDFTVTTLSTVANPFARLIYLASLRDISNGRYEHEGLKAVYADEGVQQALQLCHEQIFERILEMPLALQEADLRSCLEGMEGGSRATAIHWRRMEAYRMLIPESAPDYLKELFCSNVRALLEIVLTEHAPPRGSA